jgi:serine/threonine protein kinase
MRSLRATRLGDVLNGAYELNELLSAQDSHEIYRATERKNGRGVRVKVLRAEFALQGKVVEGFLRAPRSLQKLTHTSLPSVRVDSDDTGIPFVIEEAVDGRPLDELLAGFPQGVPLGLATHVLVPLVEALALAHEQGLLHGAIDPTRVRWLGTPTAPLLKLLELGETRSSSAAWDASYRAPELARNAPATKQADVFAVGVLAYRLLCGELPFGRGGERALPLDEVAPQLPAAWVDLTAACLEVDPRRRCPDAAALLQRIRACTREPSAAPKREPVLARSAAPKQEPYSLRSPLPKSEARCASPRPVAPARARTGDARARIAVDDDKTQQVRAEAALVQTRVTRPREVTMSAVAAAFAPLEDQTADGAAQSGKPTSEPAPATKNRNSRARDIASKLSAKPQAEARARMSVAPPTPPSPALTSARPGDGRMKQPLTQGQIAAVALTEIQLDALRALRLKDEEDDDRWLLLFLMAFLMLLLQLALPLLYEPQMARARALFGTKLQLASAGFAVVVVIATARIWGARIQSNSLLMRTTSFTMMVVAACVTILCATRFTSSGGAGTFSGMARSVLPWGMSFLFFLFAFGGMLRSLRSLSRDVLYALLVMLLSTGSLYGSYRAVFSTVLAGKHWSDVAVVRGRDPRIALPSDLDALKKQANDKTSMAKWQEDHQDIKAMEQRSEVGANEAEDLKSLTEIRDTRTHNQAMLNTALQPAPAAPVASSTAQ